MMSFRQMTVGFLLAQAIGACAWWCVLFAWPESRQAFLAKGAPDSTLFAFILADTTLVIGTAGACAYGFHVRRRWAWPMLLVHTGAAGYAALYCWTLVALTGGDGLLGALLMSPSLIIPGGLAWATRPESTVRS